jgi:hypothetical protein
MAAVSQTRPIENDHKQAHTSSSKLEDQAALAALYVTKYDYKEEGQEFLDGDRKLSSAGTLRLE